MAAATNGSSECAARLRSWVSILITIRELVPPEESLQPAEQYTRFHPAEVARSG